MVSTIITTITAIIMITIMITTIIIKIITSKISYRTFASCPCDASFPFSIQLIAIQDLVRSATS